MDPYYQSNWTIDMRIWNCIQVQKYQNTEAKIVRGRVHEHVSPRSGRVNKIPWYTTPSCCLLRS